MYYSFEITMTICVLNTNKVRRFNLNFSKILNTLKINVFGVFHFNVILYTILTYTQNKLKYLFERYKNINNNGRAFKIGILHGFSP